MDSYCTQPSGCDGDTGEETSAVPSVVAVETEVHHHSSRKCLLPFVASKKKKKRLEGISKA